MAILDELRVAASAALSAGANAARAQGTALRADFENLIRPGLDGILAMIADIGEDFTAGNIGADQAREDLATQLAAVQDLIVATAELALLSVQIVVNAVLDAIRGVINAAAGIALL